MSCQRSNDVIVGSIKQQRNWCEEWGNHCESNRDETRCYLIGLWERYHDDSNLHLKFQWCSQWEQNCNGILFSESEMKTIRSHRITSHWLQQVESAEKHNIALEIAQTRHLIQTYESESDQSFNSGWNCGLSCELKLIKLINQYLLLKHRTPVWMIECDGTTHTAKLKYKPQSKFQYHHKSMCCRRETRNSRRWGMPTM